MIKNKLSDTSFESTNQYVGPIVLLILYGLGSLLGFKGAVMQAGFILLVFFCGSLFFTFIVFVLIILSYIFGEKLNIWFNIFDKKIDPNHKRGFKKIIIKIFNVLFPEAVSIFFIAFFVKGLSLFLNKDFYTFGDIYFLPIAYLLSLLWIKIITNHTKTMSIFALIGFFAVPMTAKIFVPILNNLFLFLNINISNLNFTPTPIVFMTFSFFAIPLFVFISKNIVSDHFENQDLIK